MTVKFVKAKLATSYLLCLCLFGILFTSSSQGQAADKSASGKEVDMSGLDRFKSESSEKNSSDLKANCKDQYGKTVSSSEKGFGECMADLDRSRSQQFNNDSKSPHGQSPNYPSVEYSH